ncbi:hypothetical protein ITJ44_15595 [Clavibacter sp. VKM Ac-2873]|uniref:hypothetical protein n=1 Tax=Clavibacter sp. VKM Ac-2873 TaxID=2783813 RepID=UPI00188C4848|nr:hypothetical protein [Clavibacter sp. VKM Ac-2873]MBF4619499.1 hypothetical protein [Clavibacter sp. VKM Ac-2873]
MTPLLANQIVEFLKNSVSDHSSTNIDVISQTEGVQIDWFAPAFLKVAAIIRETPIEYAAGVSIYTGREDDQGEGTRATINVVVLTNDLVVTCSVDAGRHLEAESEVIAHPRSSIVSATVTHAELPVTSVYGGAGRPGRAEVELSLSDGATVLLPPEGSVRREGPDGNGHGDPVV